MEKQVFIPNELLFAEVQARLQEGQKVRIRVRGNSMLPFLRHNDDVLLASPRQRKPRKGSVVVARTEEMGIVMHRIVAVDGERYTLLGDGNVRQFEHTSPGGIIAVAVRYYRGRRSFSPESLPMRFIALVWYWMHPWRKSAVQAAWKIKQLITP